MTFDKLLDYMYEHHRMRRQKDIANYFAGTTQAISNWKRTNTGPSKYAIKLQVALPSNYVQLVESLTVIIITLNKSIKDIKALQSIVCFRIIFRLCRDKTETAPDKEEKDEIPTTHHEKSLIFVHGDLYDKLR